MVASRPIAPSRPPLLSRSRLAASALVSTHVAAAAWLFAPALFGGRMPYLRDVSTYFHPNLVFLERSLDHGVWPLWHPGAEGGSPFLATYPVDALLVACGGARLALVAGPFLHTLLASLGAAALSRELGTGRVAATVAGLVFAVSGFMVSALNLVEKHQAAAWAPLVLLAVLRCLRRARARDAAVLAAASALQVSTLAGEIVLQTALAALVLSWGRLGRRGAVALAAAGAASALLAAPALAAAASVMRSTRRAAGFSPEEALAGSASPFELASLVLPRFFGDVHTFTDRGFWGQELFAGGFPYLLSLYVGLTVVTIAMRSGRDRLWILVAVGLLLALGRYGPAAPVVAALAVFRTPVKFVFLSSLGLALLAGRGLERARAGSGAPAILAPALLLAAAGTALHLAPDPVARALGAVPALAAPAAQSVIRGAWPASFLVAGALAVAAAVVVARGGRLAMAAGALAVLDLLTVNGDVNRFAPARFYDLRPEVRSLLAPAFGDGASRVFGYGIGNTPGLRFHPRILLENTDVWLYYLDRQVLWGRTPVLDGLEGAFDEDRTAWAPPGASLSAAESVPAAFASIHARLRMANVRWVLSFAPLPAELVAERGAAVLPEVLVPLRLYELRDPLPRAFFVARPEDVASIHAPPPVDASADGPHAVVLRGTTPPGHFILLSGWNEGWRAVRDDGAVVAVERAGERAIALATPGGARTFRLEYRPAWWPRALALFALGAALSLAAVVGERLSRRDRGGRPAPA